MNRHHAFAALTAIFLASQLAGAQGLAQGLAEAARSERARRTAIPQAAEAAPITNATLAARGLLTNTESSTTSAIPAAKTTEAAPQPATESQTKKEERGEQWWRAQFAAARENVSRSEGEAQAAEAELKKTSNDFLLRSDIYNKEGQLGPKLQTQGAEAEAAKKRAGEARQKLADLEEDLRHAGGLPGWAR